MTDQTDAPRKHLVLIGGGEHARVVLDAAVGQGCWLVVGFVDPSDSLPLRSLGVPWLGDDRDAAATVRNAHAVLGIGSIESLHRREALASAYDEIAVTWAAIVHPSAVVAGNATIAGGAVVLAGAVINPGARLGLHCIVNTGAIVEHDVDVGDYAHVGPGTTIGGGAVIGRGAFVGLGAAVRDHIAVGEGAVVGMGSVVLESVPARGVVAGVPARAIRSRTGTIDVPSGVNGRA